MKMSACPTVSELGASESNEGDGSSLKSSGTSGLDKDVISPSALTPFGFNNEFGISFAFSYVPMLEDNTGRGIAGHDIGVGISIDSVGSSVDLFLVTSIVGQEFLEIIILHDEIFAIV